MKKFLKYALIWVIFIFALNLYMFLGSLIPKNLVNNNIIESSKILLLEKNYKTIFWYTVDNFTDAIIINQEYSINENNPVYSYMSGRRNYDPEKTKKTIVDAKYVKGITEVDENYQRDQVGTLNELINGKIDIAVNYARYWHGYMPILRVLLILFNITEIRILLLILFIGLLIYFGYLLKKRFGLTVSLIFIYGLIVEDYLFVPFSISHTSIYFISLISSIILLNNIEKIKNFGIYLFLIGCFTCSMDLITVPLLTLLIPLFIYILNAIQTENKLNFWSIIKFCFAWVAGYGLTWLSKWVIYDLIYKEGLISSAITSVKYRSSHKTNLIYNILKNINRGMIFISIGIILFTIKAIFRKDKFSLKNIKKEKIFILIVSMFPIIWYFLIMEHSSEHFFFTYRLMSGCIIGILLFINSLIKKDRKDVEIKCQSQKK